MGCSGFKPSPAPLNYLKKRCAATDHTVCVYTTLIVVITCDCVVPNCMCVCVFVMTQWVPGRVASG